MSGPLPPTPPSDIDISKFPFRIREWAEAKLEVERTDDGGWIFANVTPQPSGWVTIPGYLRQGAIDHGDRVLVGKRPSEGAPWETLSWAEAHSAVVETALGLRALGLGPQRPVMILTEASLNHTVLVLACLMAGIPVSSVSPPYSLLAGARPKLHHVFDTVRPGFVFVEDLRAFGPALADLTAQGRLDGVIVASVEPGSIDGIDVVDIDSLRQETADPFAVSAAMVDELLPTTHARYLFTSGSTGMPKGVIFTHGMIDGLIRSSIAMRGVEDADEERVYLDWMPWSHASAGFGRLAQIFYSGASLYLDDGNPTPERFKRTVANIKDVRPTHYVGAPLMWNMLAQEMEQDEELRSAFFSRLVECQYGSAAMAQSTYERLLRLSIAATGEKMVWGTGYGASESILICSSWWPVERVGHMGVPIPGNILKLAPVGQKFEVRLKGPILTPGYLHRKDLTDAGFDDDGWYCTGDAAKWLDESNPRAGLVFDGRLAEQFKLITGTWVSAGTLRIQAISAGAPLIRDVVVCGENQNEIGLLVWPNVAECAGLVGPDGPSGPDHSVGTVGSAPIDVAPALLDALQRGFETHNAANPASSTRIARFVILAEPPSMEHQEITEKGYVNQASARTRRAADIELLFSDTPSDRRRVLH